MKNTSSPNNKKNMENKKDTQAETYRHSHTWLMEYRKYSVSVCLYTNATFRHLIN